MSASIQNLRRRSELMRAARNFFYRNGFFEVETPVRIPAPAPEEYIEAVTADGEFLRTSPELALKCMLSAGADRIFELGSAFRSGEMGRRHREEFTILEYYAAHWDYRQLAEFTAAMVKDMAVNCTGSGRITYQGEELDLGEHEYITVDEAFRRFAGVSAAAADRSGDFDELMVMKVEPRLGRGKLTFLIDYPATRASLARRKAGDPAVAERWELYGAGIELGNAFGELTDPVEQRERFRQASEFRAAQGMHAYPEASEFFAALEKGLPESSGCALGFDRLTMLMLDAADIAQVRF